MKKISMVFASYIIKHSMLCNLQASLSWHTESLRTTVVNLSNNGRIQPLLNQVSTHIESS